MGLTCLVVCSNIDMVNHFVLILTGGLVMLNVLDPVKAHCEDCKKETCHQVMMEFERKVSDEMYAEKYAFYVANGKTLEELAKEFGTNLHSVHLRIRKFAKKGIKLPVLKMFNFKKRESKPDQNIEKIVRKCFWSSEPWKESEVVRKTFDAMAEMNGIPTVPLLVEYLKNWGSYGIKNHSWATPIAMVLRLSIRIEQTTTFLFDFNKDTMIVHRKMGKKDSGSAMTEIIATFGMSLVIVEFMKEFNEGKYPDLERDFNRSSLVYRIFKSMFGSGN